MRLKIEERIKKELPASTGTYNFEDLVQAWLKANPPSPFKEVRGRPAGGDQAGRDIDAKWNTALWFFECKRYGDTVGLPTVAAKVIQLLCLPIEAKPDAVAFILTETAGKGIVDDVMFVVEHILRSKPYLWDGGEPGGSGPTQYTRLLLTCWETTKTYLAKAGINLSQEETDEADAAAASNTDFFSTLDAPPKSRGERAIILIGTYLNARLTAEGGTHRRTEAEQLADMEKCVQRARKNYDGLSPEDRKKAGSFKDYWLDCMGEIMSPSNS